MAGTLEVTLEAKLGSTVGEGKLAKDPGSKAMAVTLEVTLEAKLCIVL